ncbi:MAG: TraB/GumN family protein [Candidatus Methanofastidiosia archaeon]
MVLKRVTVGANELILVGTAHVSKKSKEEVKATLEQERPDIVGVELDKGRFDTVTNDKAWKEMDIYKIIRQGKSHMFIANILLSNFQRKLGDELGTRPGAEMIQAINDAGDATIELLDRDINITFKRAWMKMSLREKLKILYSILFSFLEENDGIDAEMIEKIQEEDMLSSMLKELSREIPNIKGVLIDERDVYIAGKIKNALEGSEKKKMVAVVGAGHMQGIIANLDKQPDLQMLEAIPQKTNWMKVAAWIVPAIFIALIGWGFYSKGGEMTLQMLKTWFLINGTLSTIGVLCALGHPISAATAFLVAPFTSLNPTIAAGWFAGLSEAYVRKPKVKDFEALRMIDSTWDLWRNTITRTLLVVAFANIGSTIGTVVALPYLASLI